MIGDEIIFLLVFIVYLIFFVKGLFIVFIVISWFLIKLMNSVLFNVLRIGNDLIFEFVLSDYRSMLVLWLRVYILWFREVKNMVWLFVVRVGELKMFFVFGNFYMIFLEVLFRVKM